MQSELDDPVPDESPLEAGQIIQALLFDPDFLDPILPTLPESVQLEFLLIMGDAFTIRFKLRPNLEELDRVIAAKERALSLLPLTGSVHIRYFNSLTLNLQKRFEISKLPKDLDRLIEKQEELVACSQSTPEHVAVVNNLANSLQRRYQLTNNANDLDRAIELQQGSLASGDDNDGPGRWLQINNLGCALILRASLTKNLDDINKAVALHNQAVALTPDDQPERPTYLYNLGSALRSRFLLTRSTTDLHDSISVLEDSLKRDPAEANVPARPHNYLGDMLHQQYKITNDPNDLERSISFQEKAITLAAETDPNLAEFYDTLAMALESRFKQSQNLDDLNRVIQMRESSLALTSFNSNLWRPRRDVLVFSLATRYNRIRGLDDLERIITATEQALALDSTSNITTKAKYLIELANALDEKFRFTGATDDLNRSIESSEEAIALMPMNDSQRLNYVQRLANSLTTRFSYTRSDVDINKAIELLESTVDSNEKNLMEKMDLLEISASQIRRQFESMTIQVDNDSNGSSSITPGHTKSASSLDDLGRALQDRFAVTGSLDDIERAIKLHILAATTMQSKDFDQKRSLNNLATALMARFEHIRIVDDLDAAIDILDSAVASSPGNHLGQSTIICNWCSARFSYTGKREFLDRAINILMDLKKSITESDPAYPLCLNRLNIVLLKRFKITGSSADLEDAIEMQKKAVELVSDNNPRQSTFLENLGSSLLTRFKNTGNVADLDQASARTKIAVNVANTDSSRSVCLTTLGVVLLRQFQQNGVIENLETSIEAMERAVALAPKNDQIRAFTLNYLGNALLRRFERMGSLSDLNEAIKAQETCTKLTPADLPDRPGRLNNLGIVLQRRFERLGAAEDLDRSISVLEDAVTSTPKEDMHKIGRLSNLGASLHTRFERTKSAGDLDRAILMLERAVEQTPPGHADGTICLNNLATALLERFNLKTVGEDLNRSIMTMQKALISAPADHFARSAYLIGLGEAFQKRYEIEGSIKDLESAITAFEEGLSVATAPPSTRISAALAASALLTGKDNYRAKRVLEAAVGLLPTVSPRLLSRSDQQYNISRFAGLTADAVSLCLECDQNNNSAGDALQLFELGRGILASLQLELRSDISLLEKSHPDLAKEFVEVRDQINEIPSKYDSSSDNDGMEYRNPNNQRELSKNLDRILRTIRELPEFDRFLLGLSESDMKTLAERGPIVALNVSKLRSDALIVEPDRITSFALPLLKYSDLQNFSQRFQRVTEETVEGSFDTGNRQIAKVLQWLWDVAVGPLLDHLGFTRNSSETIKWPRMWWVANGLLNNLPLHAAGYHDRLPTMAALDRVISSYIPSIKSFGYSIQKGKEGQAPKRPNACLIGMKTTPGQSDLPFAEKEISTVQSLLQVRFPVQIMKHPTRDEVLSTFRNYDVVHFSCHGISAADPSESKLLLEDWKISPLTVSDILSMNLQQCRIAYLSACHTAMTRDKSLLDESIHLLSAIQLAGFPSVIGTLWRVGDKYSAEIAQQVYEWMLRDNDELDTSLSAEALHRAVRSLRDKTRRVPGFDRNFPTDLLNWAPYIHIGI